MNNYKQGRQRINSAGQIDEYFKRKREQEKAVVEEQEQEVSKKSKKVGRTPTKERQDSKENMDELKSLIENIGKDLKEIKAENKVIKQEQRDTNKQLKEQLENQVEEMKLLREEIKEIKEQWKRDKDNSDRKIQELEHKMWEMEQKLEVQEREKRRNNLIITGIKIDTEDKNVLKEATENFIKQNLKVEAKIKTAYKIGESRCIIEMENLDGKIEVLKNKSKLKQLPGQKVYLNSDLTYMERKIQAQIRERAEKEKLEGKKVIVGYQKLTVNNNLLRWNKKKGALEDDSKN